MNIPLTFGEYKGRSIANAQELVNMMTESDQQGGSAPYYLVGTPGCKEYVDLGKHGEGRGGFVFPGTCLCVVDIYLFSINTNTSGVTEVGTLDTSTGAVQFCENPDQVMLIDGQHGYAYNKKTKTLAKITDADFPKPKACTWKDGYGVVVQKNTGKIYVSDINDFTSWDALDFTTAEFEPDNLVGCIAAPDTLFAFGEKTVQAYYNSGNPYYPFDPQRGANLQVGCGATNSVAAGNNLVFWLDETGVVRMLAGYTPQTISTRQIEYRISKLSTFADARGSVYTQEGHFFYVLTFPANNLTLVFDVTTQQWHRRTSGRYHGRWRGAWVAQDADLVLAGDYGNGKVYQLDTDTYTDNADFSKWIATCQDVNNDHKMILHDKLELLIETGIAEQDEDPQLWMQYSDDDGKTWSREKWASMGEIGAYTQRIRWYNLGQSRSRIYRFQGTAGVKRNIISAHLEGRPLGY